MLRTYEGRKKRGVNIKGRGVTARYPRSGGGASLKSGKRKGDMVKKRPDCILRSITGSTIISEVGRGEDLWAMREERKHEKDISKSLLGEGKWGVKLKKVQLLERRPQSLLKDEISLGESTAPLVEHFRAGGLRIRGEFEHLEEKSTSSGRGGEREVRPSCRGSREKTSRTDSCLGRKKRKSLTTT